MDNKEPYSSEKVSKLLLVPAKALGYSSRLNLSFRLNLPQALPAKSGRARDYRGLAELMKIPNEKAKTFELSNDPTMKILNEWELNPNASIGQLIKFLEEMERYDIITDVFPLFGEL